MTNTKQTERGYGVHSRQNYTAHHIDPVARRKQQYSTYEVSVKRDDRVPLLLTVRAVDADAARADVEQSYAVYALGVGPVEVTLLSVR